MKKYLLAFALLAFSFVSAQAQSKHSKSITISPLLLIFPVLEVTGEFSMSDKTSVAGIVGFGKIFDVTLLELGGQYNYYVLGNFQHGMQLGGEALYANLSASDNNSDAEASGNVISVGPYIGYKYAADFGLTVNIQGGWTFGAGTVKVTGSQGSGGQSISATGPLLNLNAGWSF